MDRRGNGDEGSEKRFQGLPGPRLQHGHLSGGLWGSSGPSASDFARQELVVARLLSADASGASALPQQLPHSFYDTAEGVSSNPFVVGASRTAGISHGNQKTGSIGEAQQARVEVTRGARGDEEEVPVRTAEPQGSKGDGRSKTRACVEESVQKAVACERAESQASQQQQGVQDARARDPPVAEVVLHPKSLPSEATERGPSRSEAAANTGSGIEGVTGGHSSTETIARPSQLPVAVELFCSTETAEEASLLPSLTATGEHSQVLPAAETSGMEDAVAGGEEVVEASLLSYLPVVGRARVTKHERHSRTEVEEQEGEEEGASPLSLLAEDLVQELLRRVSLSSGNLQHSLTCQRWHQLVPGTQESVVVREGARLSEDVLLRQLAELPEVTSLHLKRYSLESLSDTFLSQMFRSNPQDHGEHPQDSSRPQGDPDGRSVRGPEAEGPTEREVATRLVRLRIDRLAARDARMTPQGLESVLCSASGLTSLELLGNPCVSRELTLPRGISSLVNLRELVLCSQRDQEGPAKCLLVRSIPHTIGALTSLSKLALRSDNLEFLPDSFTALQSLTDLMLVAPNLRTLPANINALTKLQHFFLGSKSLTDLPEAFVLLRALQRLELACPVLASLPHSMHLLRSLSSLRVASCESLRELPPSLSALTGLTDLAASSALTPHDLARLGPPALRRLQVCPGYLFELPSPAAPILPHLRVLSVASDAIWRLPTDLGQLEHVRRVVLKCPLLEQIPGSFCSLRALAHLTLAGCTALRSLPDAFHHLSSLTTFHISSSGLNALPPGFSLLPALQVLSLSWCSRLESLPEDIGALTSLKDLTIDTCNVGNLPGSLSGCVNLETLELTRCLHAPALHESIGTLGSLKRLRFCQYPMLLHLTGAIGQLSRLEELELKGLSAINSLPEALGSLGSLKSLYIGFCPKLEGLPGSLGDLSSLEGLTIEACHELVSLPQSLGALGRLGRLKIVSCARLLVLPRTLGGLGALGHLELRGLDSLGALPESLGSLSHLHRLELHHCPQISELPKGLGSLRRLQRLELNFLGSLRTLPLSLRRLTDLTDVRLAACRSLDSSSVQALLSSLPNLSAASRQSLQAAL